MKRFLLAAIAALATTAALAQETQQVTGKITMLGDLPVQNMKVVSSITGDTATSNSNGVFSIKTCEKDQLSINCYPFKPLRQKIKMAIHMKDTVKMELSMPRKASLLADIMEKGYLDSTYEQEAFSKLTFQKDWTKYVDIEQAISVEFPSLQMVSKGCYQMPGSTQGCMLTVVGNRPDDISTIPITNVEDIYILKGAQATVWGVQGSNGVLVVKIKNTDMDLDTRDKN